jgi:hypothetical protein
VLDDEFRVVIPFPAPVPPAVHDLADLDGMGAITRRYILDVLFPGIDRGKQIEKLPRPSALFDEVNK